MIKFGCQVLFKLMGWRYRTATALERRNYVVVCAPHTSNWDFIPAMTVANQLGRSARFVIKNEWLRFPMGLILKPMGALGIDRHKIKSGTVKSSTDLIAHLFAGQTELMLLIAPEGTRSAANEWKSGFWHIAHKAQVPMVLAYADFAKKEAGTGPIIFPTDFEQDMRAIMNFYRGVSACVPEKFKLDQRYSSPIIDP